MTQLNQRKFWSVTFSYNDDCLPTAFLAVNYLCDLFELAYKINTEDGFVYKETPQKENCKGKSLSRDIIQLTTSY